jgi:hypothetical protein
LEAFEVGGKLEMLSGKRLMVGLWLGFTLSFFALLISVAHVDGFECLRFNDRLLPRTDVFTTLSKHPLVCLFSLEVYAKPNCLSGVPLQYVQMYGSRWWFLTNQPIKSRETSRSVRYLFSPLHPVSINVNLPSVLFSPFKSPKQHLF